MKDYKLEKLFNIIMNSGQPGERPPSDTPSQVSCWIELKAAQRSNTDDKKQSVSRT